MPQLSVHIRCRKLKRKQAVGAQLYLNGLFIAANPRDLAHTSNGRQLTRDNFVHEIRQLFDAAGWVGHGIGQDRLACHIDALHIRFRDGVGQVATNAGNGIFDVIQRAVRIGFQRKFNGDIGQAIRGRRSNMLDPGHIGYSRFNGFYDLVGNFGRCSACLTNGYGDDWDVDIGELRDR